MSRGFVPTLFFVLSAVLFFGLGSLFASRQSAATEEDQIASLRAEVGLLKRQQTAEEAAVATAGHLTDRQPPGAIDDQSRAALVNDIKKQLRSEMGLLPVSLLRERRQSFVELYSYDTSGASNYGTAGYLGHGYFITVKHAVIALGDPTGARKITSVKLMYNGHAIPATIVDTGDADVEVDPGDWAILKVKDQIDLPPLDVDLSFGFDFADPIFRLGNDYSRGIIVSTGYVGQRTSNNLVTCLTDGHPGVSGGGVLNGDGQLVGIPIGRMQGDFRFSFILPLRPEMFRKTPRIAAAATPTVMP